MKVTNNAPPNASASQEVKIQEKGPASAKIGRHEKSQAPTPGGATVEISDRARLLKQATEIANLAPDTRQDKVAALKKSLNDGTYRVDSSAIAESLINEHLNSDFGKNSL